MGPGPHCWTMNKHAEPTWTRTEIFFYPDLRITPYMMSNQPALFVLPAEDCFNGNNWFTWHGTIWSAAGAYGIQGYLEGTIQKPSPLKPGTTATATSYWGSKNPSPEEWEQRNTYAKSLVNLNVKNPIRHGIQPMDTAAEAWATLKDIHSIVRATLWQSHNQRWPKGLRAEWETMSN